ncbi:MAG TPA: SDR family NAD(P)-dependent oxidoreductase [Chloroflexia bacterium]|nr:SDR family NAD(P)-dependent oxidoreductase [Chloroflexia bacterium]
MNLKGKVALITGGGTGLGQEIAQKLAAEGMDIAVHYSRSRDEALATVKILQESGVKAEAFQADLNAPTSVAESKQMIEEVAKRFGRLDLLVNNAGTTRGVPFTQIEKLDEADWNNVLNVNTKAPFFTTQAAVEIMRQNGGGQIINTASISGLRAGVGSSIAYAVSKAAMIHLTKCLAVALAPDIRVNAVAPGFLQTRWSANFTAEQLQAVTQQALLKKATSLSETADVYLMLARNESITGQVITVDAGVIL